MALAALCLMAGWALPVQAQRVLDLSEDHASQALLPAIEMLADADGSLGADEVMARWDAFRDPADPSVSAARLGHWVRWLRFSLRNPGDVGREVAIHFDGSHRWLHARVFELRAGRLMQRWEMGQAVPRAGQGYANSEVAWPCQLGPGEERSWVLRVEVKGRSLLLDAAVRSPEDLSRDLLQRAAWVWGYAGILLLATLYHLVLFARLRDPGYGYFSLVCGATLAVHGHGYGMFQQVTGLGASVVGVNFFGQAGVLLAASWCLFTSVTLDAGETMPRFHRWLRGAGYAQLGLSGVLLFTSPLSGMYALFGWSTVSMMLCVLAGVLGMRAGYGPARLYLASWGVYFLALGLNIGAWTGIFDAGAFQQQFVRIGSTFQILMFALVLSERYALIHRRNEETQAALIESQTQRMEAQKDALRTKEEAAANLQRKVDERTVQLRSRTEEAEQARERSEAAQVMTEAARRDAEMALDKVALLEQQKTEFFQSISHELRTPLTLILNPLEHEARARPDNDNVGVAARNARRLLRLVNQLLDFQKLAAGKRELRLRPVDLVRFMDTCCEYFAPYCRGKRIFLDTSVDGQPVGKSQLGQETRWVSAEVDALEKIAFNFLSNALKYTPRGGRIEVAVQSSGAHVKFCVTDNGPGIPGSQKDRIFEMFAQGGGDASREQESTGIGLALVKQLAEAMSAEVGVESEEGQGSTFWLRSRLLSEGEFDPECAASFEEFHVRDWLMADRRDTSDDVCTPEGQPAAAPEGDGPLVLVVDDLRDMRDVIRETLVAEGYRTVEAAGGEQALQVAREVCPDLVLTDWMMPGMTGPKLIEQLRADTQLRSIPTVLLTARSDEESRALGTQQGADAFLGKPFNDQELLATLRNLLALKDREREVEALNQRLAQEGLMRCLPPALVEGLMSGSMELDREPHGVSATLLVCSLQGFNTHTRSLQASRTARMLDAYLGAVSDAAFAHGATVDRFNGDEVVLIFGAPTQMSDPEQVRRAGLCALDIQAAVAGLRTAWEERKLPIPEVRIAIHQGTIMVGTFGGEQRTEYTAVGPNVARTQQLHRRCKAGQIWISRTATDRLPDSCTEEVGELSLCPAETPDMVFHLLPSSRLVLESFTSAA